MFAQPATATEISQKYSSQILTVGRRHLRNKQLNRWESAFTSGASYTVGSTNDDWNDLLASIRAEAERIRPLAPDAIWYLFGSTLRAFERAADIDVLVLCDSEESISVIRHELRAACERRPLHLFLLTRGEEAELGFIVSQGCVQVYPLGSPNPD